MRKTKKVLVIDDDPNVIKILEKWLNNAGYQVLGALNGTEGVAKSRTESPDLVLSDMMLPDINGVEVAKTLKADPTTSGIPVIFMTVTMGVELDKGDETIDIDGLLFRIFAKPLHNRKLLTEIRKSINRRIHGNVYHIKGS